MDLLATYDLELVRADNPGPFSLEGTNTWLVGRDPCWVVDPGPEMPDHVAAVLAAAQRRGGVEGIVVTHDHADHAGAVADVAASAGAPPVFAARLPGADRIHGGDAVGPFNVVATPGHAPDHLAFVAARTCFTGDAVLGRGSVFVAPARHALRAYLAALQALRALDLSLICPGHGPVVEDPGAKLDEYISHRLERERRLLRALSAGARTLDELLDQAWSDAPGVLRPAATVTLAAHLDKLAEEGRLPDGVERPDMSWWPFDVG
jgi:glyoxylase-like metal-dependent hydrolase (beta-lactamase superfamily II)